MSADSSSSNLWKIVLVFKKEHSIIHEEKLDPITVTGNTKVYSVIEDVLMKALLEKLKWPGYALYCGAISLLSALLESFFHSHRA